MSSSENEKTVNNSISIIKNELKQAEDSLDDIDMILHPHGYAIKDTLEEINTSKDLERKKELIEELTLIFNREDLVYTKDVINLFPKILDLLKDKELYECACVLLADTVRHKNKIQNLFYELGIFDKLDFEKYKPSVSVVYSMCYGNKKIKEAFMKKYYKKARDCDNELIKMMQDN